MNEHVLEPYLTRIALALEAMAAPKPAAPDFDSADAFVWSARRKELAPVHKVNRIPIALLVGIDLIRDQLVGNTERFARGLPANNVLLWGARGMGKSSLVKAAHAAVSAIQRAAHRSKTQADNNKVES